jgi:hypothetical protein
MYSLKRLIYYVHSHLFTHKLNSLCFCSCYSLYFKCLPKAHVLKASSTPPGWHFWEVPELLCSKASWDALRSWKVWIWRGLWDSALFFLVFVLRNEVTFCGAFLLWCAITRGPRQMANWSWTRICKTVRESKPFLLISWLPQVFVLVTESRFSLF